MIGRQRLRLMDLGSVSGLSVLPSRCVSLRHVDVVRLNVRTFLAFFSTSILLSRVFELVPLCCCTRFGLHSPDRPHRDERILLTLSSRTGKEEYNMVTAPAPPSPDNRGYPKSLPLKRTLNIHVRSEQYSHCMIRAVHPQHPSCFNFVSPSIST